MSSLHSQFVATFRPTAMLVIGVFCAFAFSLLAPLAVHAQVTISGTLYENDGVTPITRTATITAAVGTSTVSLHSTTTAADGSFSIAGIATSTIGAWATTVNSNVDARVNEMVFANGLHVSISQFSADNFSYSEDGIIWFSGNWSSAPFPSGLAYGNGVFVSVLTGWAFGGPERVGLSEDGVNWEFVSAAGDNDNWQSVTYGNGRFVAVADCLFGGDCVMYSDDGREWVVVSATANTRWYGVKYGNGRFVAVGDEGNVMYSSDGISWTAGVIPDGNWRNLEFGSGVFLAASEFRVVATSSDGASWSAVTPVPFDSFGPRDELAYGNGAFVAADDCSAADVDACVWFSNDLGASWATSTVSTTGTYGAVGFGNGRFYVFDTSTTENLITYADAGFGEDTPITLFVDENATTSSSTANTLTFGLNGESGGAITADLIADTLYLHKPSRGSSSNEIWLSDVDFYDAEEGGAGDQDLLFTATTSTTTVNADLRISSSTVLFAPQNLVVDGDFDNQGTFFAERGELVAASVAYDVASARVTDELDVSANGGFLEDIRFSSDGTRMYIAGNAQDDVDQYSLAVPWNVTTATYDYATDTFNGSETNNNGLAFSATGTFMYVLGAADDEVDQYVLGTPWDVSTAAYFQSTSTNTGKNEDFPRFVDFSSSGHKMYLGGTSWDEVFEYDLFTPWDVSTAAYVQALDLGTNHNPYGITLSEDGTVIAIAIRPSDKFDHIAVYSLSMPWDLSSASLTNELNVDGVATDIEGIEFRPDGSQLFALSPGGGSSGRVYTFQLDTPQTFSGTLFATSSLHDFTVGDTATISLHTTVDVGGAYTNNGVVERGGGTITLTGTSTIYGDGVMGSLRISGTATSVEDSYTVENLTIDSGAEYVAPAAQLTVTGEYSNDGQAMSSAAMRFTGGDAYGVGNMYRSSESLDVSPQSDNIRSLTFGLDGRKLYTMSGPAAMTLYEYDLATAYDLSTASYTGRSAPPVGYDVHVSSDGGHFFVLSDFLGGYDLQAYTATSSFNVSTLESSTSSVLVLEGFPDGLFIDRSGTRVYVAYFDEIQQYELAETNNLDTASFVASTSIGARDLYISDDGTRLSVVNSAGFREYTLSTPWDITTATWTDTETPHSAFGTGNVRSLYIAPSVNRVFGLDYGVSVSVDAFIMGAEHSGTLTGTSALGDVTFTSSTTHTFLDNASTSNFTIESNATVTAPSQLTVDGSYENAGVFQNNTGSVYFGGVGSYTLDLELVHATSVAAQSTTVRGVSVSPSGDRMYVIEGANNEIVEYSLSSANDISTAQFTASSSIVESESGAIRTDLYITDDGTRLFVSGRGVDDVFTFEKVYEYSFGTPFDVTTLSYVASTTLDVPGSNLYGLDFRPDGLAMYVVYENDFSDSILEYRLGAPFDITTTNPVSVNSLILYPNAINASAVRFAPDGSKFFVSGYTSDAIVEYTLGTPWDISTGALTDQFFTSSIAAPTPTGIDFSADGSQLYLSDATNDSVYQLLASEVARSGEMTGASAFHSVVLTDGTNVFTNSASTTNLTINAPATFTGFGSFSVGDTITNNGTFSAATTTFFVSGGALTGVFTGASAFNNLVVTGSHNASASLEVRDLEVTTSGAIDFIDVTLTGDYVNAGTVTHSGTLSLPADRFDIAGKQYFGKLDISAEEGLPYGLDFNSAGTKLYTTGGLNDSVYEYTLSEPFNILTASYVHATSVAAQDTNPKDVEISQDGTKMYVVGDQNVAIYEYDLTVPFDVSSAAFVRSADLTGVDAFPEGIALSPDGSVLLVAGDGSNVLYELTLSTPFNVSTASQTGSFSTASFDTNPEGIAVSPDGRFVFVMGELNDVVFLLTLTTPFDIDTATLTASTSVVAQSNDVREVAVDDSGEWLFIIERGSDAVHAYQLDKNTQLSGGMVGTQAFNQISKSGTAELAFLSAASSTGTFSIASTSSYFGATTTTFAAGETFTFQNVDWQGESTTSPLTLRSSSAGTEWFIDVPGSQLVVEYVDVQDSNASVGPEIVAASSTDSGNNTNWSFPSSDVLSISSAANQSFRLGDPSTPVSAVTISDDGNTPVITALNDIRIAIATGTVAMLWDTTDTAAVLTGGAAGKVSSTVSYEGGGSVLVLDVTSDFAAGESVIVSGVSFTSFTATNTATTALELYVGGDAGGAPAAIDDKTVTILPESSEASVWNSSDWTLYDTITIDAAQIDDDLSDFPVYIDLSDLSATFWSTTPSTGGLTGTDIRITNSSDTELPRELVSASSTLQTGELHFRADTISSTTDTVFKVWYNGNLDGDYAATSTYGAQNVWTNGYLAVWHFPSRVDSTANERVLSASNIATTTGALVGDAADFNGSNSVFTLAGAASWLNGLSNFTFQTWIDSDLTATDKGFLKFPSINNSDDGLTLRYDAAGANGGGTNVLKGSLDTSGGVAQFETQTGDQATTDQMWHMSWASGSAADIYKNGTNHAFTLSPPSRSGTTAFGSGTLYLGASAKDTASGGWDGRMDEVRFSDVSRSSAWIAAEYANQSDPSSFYATSSETTDQATSTLAEHPAGQRENAFSFQNKSDEPLFAFQLQVQGDSATVTEMIFGHPTVEGVTSDNVIDWRLYIDENSDGVLDVGDTQVGGSGAFSVTDATGSTTFSGSFVVPEGNTNFLLIANLNDIDRGDVLSITLGSEDITLIATSNGSALNRVGSVSSATHIRSSGGGGSGISGNFSTLGAPGAGIIGGGVPGGAGEELGGLPNFEVPTANGSPFNEWSGGGNVYVSDGAYAQATAENVRQSLSDFLYSIPGGNEVTGIEVKLEARATSNGGQIGVQLSWDGGVSSTTLRTVGPLTTTDTIYTIGGTSDDWGRAWVPADFSDANFRVRLVGLPGGGNVAEVDAISVRIYNQTGGGSAGGGAGEI